MSARENSFRVGELRESLKPFRLHFFGTLRSTNDHAAAMRKRRDLFAPAIVLAARQTAGRGRGTNTWFSAAGSVTATFVLRVEPTLAPQHVPLAAGLAVRNAAAELSGAQAIGLKWPNDVYYGERKLAGLLCERLENIDLIGVGLNVNVPETRVPRELKDRIAFLQQISTSAAPLDLTIVLPTLARHLHQSLVRRSETPLPALLREFDRHHILVGRRVSVSSAHEAPLVGKCEGLDQTGRLLLRETRPKGGRLHRIIAGHVEVHR